MYSPLLKLVTLARFDASNVYVWLLDPISVASLLASSEKVPLTPLRVNTAPTNLEPLFGVVY